MSEIYELLYQRQRLFESAATLDETYSALGVLPERPRILEYSTMWNTIYDNVKVEAGDAIDPYAALVANQTVKRYLDVEWEYANKLLTEGAKPKSKIEVVKK